MATKLNKGDIYIYKVDNRKGFKEKLLRFVGVAYVNKTPDRENPVKTQLAEYVFEVIDTEGKFKEQKYFTRDIVKFLTPSKAATVLYGSQDNGQYDKLIAIKEGREKPKVGTTSATVLNVTRQAAKLITLGTNYAYQSSWFYFDTKTRSKK